MLRSENFTNVMTSELLLKQESEFEQAKCKDELNRRLKSIGFTDKQIEQFIINDQAIIVAHKSPTLSQELMAQTKFFNILHPRRIKVEELTISEMLLATEQATSEYPCAIGGNGGYSYFEIVSDYAHQTFARGYYTAIEKLRTIGLEDDIIKKFIFAELQVIRRVTFDDKKAIDAWGEPEKCFI